MTFNIGDKVRINPNYQLYNSAIQFGWNKVDIYTVIEVKDTEPKGIEIRLQNAPSTGWLWTDPFIVVEKASTCFSLDCIDI